MQAEHQATPFGPKPASWTVSIVSHGHGARVIPVLTDVHLQLTGRPHRIILTLNQPENTAFLRQLPGSIHAHLEVRTNPKPQGFAANHNAALATSTSDYMLIADPDLRLPEPLFSPLEQQLGQAHIGIVSPQAYTADGQAEDNGRGMVTPESLFRRYILGRQQDTRRIARREQAAVDWLAGLFLAMRSETFTRLGGFDPAYFLYCEDVDLCLRARQIGLSVELIPELRIIHPANRDTLKKWRHLLWHMRSMLRLWRSPAYRAERRRRRRLQP